MVDADDVAAGVGHQLEECARSRAEVDRRDVHEGVEDPLHVWLDERGVVGRPEPADPAVEDLDDVRTRLDLGPEIGDDHRGQPLHQVVPGGGLAVHERLRRREITRGTALDQIAGEGERRAREADDTGRPSSSRRTSRIASSVNDDLGRVERREGRRRPPPSGSAGR